MLAPEQEVDVTTRNGVMAHFTWIHYTPCDRDLWPTCTKTRSCDQKKISAYFEVYRPLRFWYIRS